MKKHKVQQIIKKQGGNFQVVFSDGVRVFWPREDLRGLGIGTRVCEHKHKNGQTVAFSWNNDLRFIGPEPMHIDDAAAFVAKFKFFDRVSFNKAVVKALDVYVEPLVFPDIDKIAQYMFWLAIQRTNAKLR